MEGEQNSIRMLVKESLDRFKDYPESMKWLSTHLTTRYGSKFGGSITVEYNLVDNKFILKCGEEVREFEESELVESLPTQLEFMLKTR